MRFNWYKILALATITVSAGLWWFDQHEDQAMGKDSSAHTSSKPTTSAAVMAPVKQSGFGSQTREPPTITAPDTSDINPTSADVSTYETDGEPVAMPAQTRATADISALLNELQVLGKPTDNANYSQQLLEVRTQVIELLSTDSAALDAVALELDQFMASGNLESAEQLSEILSHIQDDAIARWAQTWLQQSQSEAQRQLALQLLKSQVIDDPDLSQAALDTVLWENDDQLWLQSVPHMLDLDTHHDAAGIIEERIQDLMVDDSPELRSRAVENYATLARRPDQIQTMALLLEDEDASVRLAAIRAMQNLSVYSDVTKTALLAVLASPEESAEIKEAAIHALDQYALNDAELDIYEQHSMLIGQ